MNAGYGWTVRMMNEFVSRAEPPESFHAQAVTTLSGRLIEKNQSYCFARLPRVVAHARERRGRPL